MCTLREFTPRFLDGYAKANRLKPSGVAGKKTVFRKHLLPRFADTKLDQITTEDVQQLKASLGSRSPKTVNNILTVLSVTLKTAVEWGVIAKMPCTIKLLRVSKSAASCHDFDEYARLVDAAKTDPLAYLVVLLGGDAGLRCGEIMALEWKDVDLQKRQLCVARSDWKGHVTATKGGRIRYVPMTVRLAEALRQGRHLKGARVAVADAISRLLLDRDL